MGADNESIEQKRKKKLREEKSKRPLLKKIFIFTEGEKTEPNYFRALIEHLNFDRKHYNIEIIGEGYNTDSLVTRAKKELEKSNIVNYIWCVFDKDSFTPKQIGRAFDLIKGKSASKISIAFSNECFELWYLLHFCYWNTGNPRCDYYPKLTDYLGEEYKKNDTGIFYKLLENLPTAIQNAVRLRNTNQKQLNNPYTDIDLMIDWLRREAAFGDKC